VETKKQKIEPLIDCIKHTFLSFKTNFSEPIKNEC
jgi:hypothetical protein